MKRFVLLAVSIVLVSIFFCPMVMAFPPLPEDLQMVQPDPSLPKELSAFFGKWESAEWFVIIAKVDSTRAWLYSYPKTDLYPPAWYPATATVKKLKDTYTLTYKTGERRMSDGSRGVSVPDPHLIEFFFRGEALYRRRDGTEMPCSRVP